MSIAAKALKRENNEQGDMFEVFNEAIYRQRWIDYPVALAALDHLQRIFDHPKTHRPPCCLMVGDTNNGKTTIGLQFMEIQNRPFHELDSQERRPVICVQAPPGPDLGELYGGILKSIAAPFQMSWRWNKKQSQLLTLLPNLGVGMIIIDEIHNINQGNRDQQILFLNGIKFLTNELRIPIVAIGTKNAETIFQTDQQMGNRFEPFRLPKWEPGVEYSKFVNRIITSSGFEPDKEFLNKRVLNQIHVESGGLTGETMKLVQSIIREAAGLGEKIISPSHFDKIDWVRPAERRRRAK